MRKSILIFLSSILFSNLIFINFSCKKKDIILVASSIEVLNGEGQSAVFTTILEEPIIILVKDQNGDPFPGQFVTFSLTEGYISSGSAYTDNEGKVTVTWMLGESIGIQTLTVTAFKIDGKTQLDASPLFINATALNLPPVPTEIELISGENQIAERNNILSNPIVIRVKDQYGNPYEGASVDFSVDIGSLSSATATTDFDGEAEVIWTLGSDYGEQTLTVTATKEDGETPLINSPVYVNALSIPVIGDYYEGGIVFYVFKEGDTRYVEGEVHGIVCDLLNKSTGVQWYNGQNLTTGATAASIGTGMANTIAIIEVQEGYIEYYAAWLCLYDMANDPTDWFLPSKDELNEIFLNKTVINNSLAAWGGALMSTYVFWSSTEGAEISAWAQNFESGNQAAYLKSAEKAVRAVKYF